MRSNNKTRSDKCHLSLRIYPGKLRVHVYVNFSEGNFEMTTVAGESVIKRNQTKPDEQLSIGEFEFDENLSRD